MSRITFADKVALNANAGIPAQNKVVDSDMNNIKNSINQLGSYVSATVATGQPGKCYITAPGTLASRDVFNVVLPSAVNPSAIAQFSVDGGTTYYPIVRSIDGSNQLVSEVANKNVVMQFNGTSFVIMGLTFEDGWVAINDTITYASATTITIAAGGLTKYTKGDKLKLIQSSTTKFFYIVDVADKLLTVTGGSSYTLTNTTISGAYFSHSCSPIGFPDWLSYTPSYTGFSSNPTINMRFKIIGTTCFIHGYASGAGTSNANTFKISLPVLPKTISSIRSYCVGYGTDNGSVTQATFIVSGSDDATNLIVCKGITETQTSWTTSGNKYCNPPTMFYEIK